VRAVHPEPHDRRFGLARYRRDAFLPRGRPELLRHLRARAPRRGRLLIQPEGDRQTRLGRDSRGSPQVLLQPCAGKESDDLHRIVARPEPKRAAFPLGEPDVGPRQIVVNDPLHEGEIEPFRRDIRREQDQGT